MSTYEETCERAADDQGLRPIMRALAGAGLPYQLAQTGGFCMAVHVVDRGTDCIWITAWDSDLPGGEAFGDRLYVARESYDAEDPIELASNATIAEAIEIVRREHEAHVSR